LWQGLAIAPQKRPQTVEAWLALFPKQEKQPLPQPKPAQVPVAKPKVDTGVAPVNNSVKAKVKPTSNNSVAKPKVETEVAPLNNSATAKVKPTPKNSKTPQSSTPTNNSIPQPTLPQLPITKIKTSGSHNYLAPKKRKPSKAGLPLKALIMTSAIATSAGVGFGFALRINSPNVPGSSILHTEQSFPPSSNWPMSKHQL
jgi:serine/threonine-protein kinase